jgi:hypothetical protein
MQTKSSALFYPEHASGFAVRQFGKKEKKRKDYAFQRS